MSSIQQNTVSDAIFAYGDHDLQKLKVFNYSTENKHTFIYIHGGAWRDPHNTFDEMDPVVSHNKDVNHIGINYRLSPEIKHPFHLVDILSGLKFIRENFQSENITLLGHSVGATMILQLLHFKIIVKEGLKYVPNESYDQNEIDQLLDYVDKNIKFDQLLFLDGIYNVVELLNEYPDYSSFVNEAFVNTEHVENSTQLSSRIPELDTPFSLVNRSTQFIIYQSLEDELLSMKQTHLLLDYLVSKNQRFSLHADNWGKHEEIYSTNRSLVFHGKLPN